MRKCTKLWTMKDGNKIRICDMGDSHLANTIKMIERMAEHKTQNAITLGYRVLCMMQGEMAQYHIEGELRHLEDYGIDPSEMSPLYGDLLGDQTRREIEKMKLASDYTPP